MGSRSRLGCCCVGDVDCTFSVLSLVECDAICLAVGGMERPGSKRGFVDEINSRQRWWRILNNSSSLSNFCQFVSPFELLEELTNP